MSTTNLRHDSLAHYLAAVGVIGLCEVGSRWQRGACEFGAPPEEVAASIEAALAGRKLLPTYETDHPLWCNRGRRSLSRGVADARAWLLDMDERQRAAELAALLGITSAPMQLSLPKGPRPNPNWNLGTLMPAVIGDPPAALVSAWLPVLAWEAQRLLLTTELRTDDAAEGAGGQMEGDVYSWLALEWGEPLTMAEVFVLLNGGPRRWHFCGRQTPFQRTVYHLRDTAGGGKTLEFCRGQSWTGVLG
jgi:hypothetical protein